jgi:hypothetical protein
MRILLVQPEYVSKGIGFRLAALTEPLHLEMLAALVPDHEVRILDLRLDPDLAGALEAFQPDLVGVTALTPEVYAALAVLRQAKAFSPEIFTVAGGHHATLLPEDSGGGRRRRARRGGDRVPAPGARRGGPDRPVHVPNLVWRDRTALRPQRDGRGLDLDAPAARPDRGLSQPLLLRARAARHRPHHGAGVPLPVQLLQRVGVPPGPHAEDVRGAGRPRAQDDPHEERHVRGRQLPARPPTGERDRRPHRAEGLDLGYSMECRTDSIVRHPELIEKWVKIGLRGVFLGLEGASDGTLAGVNQRNPLAVNDRAIEILHGHGLVIWGAFIVDPDWVEDDFHRLRDYVTAKQIPLTQFTILTPLPGTELYRSRYHELLTHDYTCFDALHAVVPTRLPREVFYQHFAALYRQTSLEPYYDLLQSGRVTIEQLRRGKTVLDSMVRWESYAEHDPVLGTRP